MILNQTKYAMDLLEGAQMLGCKLISTHMVTKIKTISEDDEPYSDPEFYRSIVEGLQYFTITRLDLAFSVNYVCQFMHRPKVLHFKMVKRIFRYVQGTFQLGFRFFNNCSLQLKAFSDAD